MNTRPTKRGTILKKFEWARILHKDQFGTDIGRTLSLLEVHKDSRRIWGSVSFNLSDVDGYVIATFNRNRELQVSIIDANTITEAQAAIEKFLMDEGILEERNEIIDLP